MEIPEKDIKDLLIDDFSTEEAEILYLTAEIWLRYSRLKILHDSHQKDFADAVHSIQRLIWMRPTYARYKKL